MESVGTNGRTYDMLALATPFQTETRGFVAVPAEVSINDARVLSALNLTNLRPTSLTVGDGVFLSYADVHSSNRGRTVLGMLLAGPFRHCKRVDALALAADIVRRLCGGTCDAYVLCCEATGVRCVKLPVSQLRAASLDNNYQAIGAASSMPYCATGRRRCCPVGGRPSAIAGGFDSAGCSAAPTKASPSAEAASSAP